MKKLRRIMRSNIGTGMLFALAAVLLTLSSVGGARAALIYSQTYSSQVEMYDIGVTLLENGSEVSFRDYDLDERGAKDPWDEGGSRELLANMLKKSPDSEEEEPLKLGYAYPEKLAVQNTGNIDEYVRVSIYKYWLKKDEKGEWVRAANLSPDLIDLHLVNEDLWQEDLDSRTSERTVLYYRDLLPVGAVSKDFADTIAIDSDVATLVEKNVRQEGNTIVTTYAYNGVRFVLEARVDAVQDHNAEDAVWSSWGRRVDVGDDTMSGPAPLDQN